MAEKKKNLRLNCVSVGTEAVFHVLIGLFSVCCIIPFLFVIHHHYRLFLHPHQLEHGRLPVCVQ